MKEYLKKIGYILKKYLYVIPIVFYQFILLTIIFILAIEQNATYIDKILDEKFNPRLFIGVFIFVTLYAVAMFVYIYVVDKKEYIKNSSAHEVVIINYAAKVSNFVATIFCIAEIAYIRPEELDKKIMLGVLIIGTSMIFTGIYSLKCASVLKKEEVLNNRMSIAATVLGFVIVIDVIMAIVLVFLVSRKEGTEVANIAIDTIKTSLKSLTVILYPYISYVVMGGAVGIFGLSIGATSLATSRFTNIIPEDILNAVDISGSSIGMILFWVIIISYNVFTFLFIIINSFMIGIFRKKAIEIACANLAVKMGHIPGHMISLIVGFIGVCLGVFGGPIIIIVAGIMLTIPLIVSGFNSIACTIKMRKERIITMPEAIIMGIGGFVFLIDILVACYYVLRAFNHDVVTKLDVEQA